MELVTNEKKRPRDESISLTHASQEPFFKKRQVYPGTSYGEVKSTVDTSMDIPSYVKTYADLKTFVLSVRKGEPLPAAEWKALVAAHPELKKATKATKRKAKTRSGRAAKRGRYGGGAAYGGRPIVTYPNISGYGGYDIHGYADVDLGDTFRGGIKGEYFHYSLFPDWFPINLGIKGRVFSDEVAGLGDYTVRRNSMLLMNGNDPPMVRNTNKGEAMVFNHREYIGDLYSGAGNNPSPFEVTKTYAINPGNPALFPWLSTLAGNFQEYEIRGMIIELKTTSADFSTTLNMGTMFGAVDYNSLDNAPVDKTHLENMEFAISSKPSRTLILPIECDPRLNTNTHLNVALNNNYQGGDKRLFDWGTLYLGSQSVPNPAGQPVAIAEIWASYEIAMFKPILPDIPMCAVSAHFQGSGATSALPLGASVYKAPGSQTDINCDGTRIFLPKVYGSVWKIDVCWVSAGTSFIYGSVGVSGCQFGVPAYNGAPASANMYPTSAGHNLITRFHAPAIAGSSALSDDLMDSAIVWVTSQNGPYYSYTPGTFTIPAGTLVDIKVTQWQLGINT